MIVWNNSADAVNSVLESKVTMKRKPDLMWILVIILSLGMVTTGYTQSLWERGDYQSNTDNFPSDTMLVPYTTADQ